MDNERLLMAIQKGGGDGSGRLTGDTIDLLYGCDFKFRITERLDSTSVTNFLLDILSMRSRDIPRILGRDMVDLGAVGLDVIEESQIPLIRLMPLGYGQCQLALAVREDIEYEQARDLKGATIATSYPNITKEFFQSRGVQVDILYLEGSVELAGFRKWAQAVIDVKERGDSLTVNKLEPREILFDSEAWLVASPNLGQKRGSERIVEEFLIRTLAFLRPRLNRYIVVNAPVSAEAAIRELIPGSLNPTITRLDDNWLDIASVVPTNRFWEITRELKELGARDIDELEIKRMIPNKDDADIIRMMRAIYGQNWQFSNTLLGGNS